MYYYHVDPHLLKQNMLRLYYPFFIFLKGLKASARALPAYSFHSLIFKTFHTDFSPFQAGLQ